MESPEDIEKALARLMPSAISEKGQGSMDDLIDSLAAGEHVPERITPERKLRPVMLSWLGGIGAAAAAVVVALSLSPSKSGSNPPIASAKMQGEDPVSQEGLVLIGSTEVVEDAVPEDWMSETNGVPHRAWRVRVVDQERLRDLETGSEFVISRPREEVRLMPVTSF